MTAQKKLYLKVFLIGGFAFVLQFYLLRKYNVK
jgi:hypothetical protein